MNKIVFWMGLLLVLVSLTPAWGQWQKQSTAVVPFEFAAGDVVLPAGTYSVLTNHTFPNSIMIRDENTGVSAVFEYVYITLTLSDRVADSKLIFTRTGNHYVLHQALLQADDHKHDLLHRSDIVELPEKSH